MINMFVYAFIYMYLIGEKLAWHFAFLSVKNAIFDNYVSHILDRFAILEYRSQILISVP